MQRNNQCHFHNQLLIQNRCLSCLNTRQICLSQLQESVKKKELELNSFKELLMQSKEKICLAMENLFILIDRQISFHLNIASYLQDLMIDANILQKMGEGHEEQTTKLFQKLEDQINDQFLKLEINVKVKQLQGVLKDFDKQFKLKSNLSFNYQPLSQASIYQNNWCQAFSFSKDNSLMIANDNEIIVVYSFKQEKLIQVQRLTGHTQPVFYLQFLQKSNQFVSTGKDAKIIIWDSCENKDWKISQCLTGHQLIVYKLILNRNENLLISGSEDSTIKFWEKQSDLWNSTQTQSIDCQSPVLSFSLCSFENKLIAALRNQKIAVLQYFDQWDIVQNISVQNQVQRLSFIDQNKFAFQPKNKLYFEIYCYNFQDYTVTKIEQIYYKNNLQEEDIGQFPICFIQDKGLLLIKNEKFVHLVKVLEKRNQFIIQKSIHYENPVIFGNTSCDGKYLAIWDRNQRLIQIWKEIQKNIHK